MEEVPNMDSSEYSVKEQIGDVSAQRPHIVILGAGASLAACPNGDQHGLPLPLMLNLVETLELGEILDQAGISHAGCNFEDVYNRIHNDPDFSSTRHLIEARVAEYFRQLELPDAPNIYDYLVLSLRPKDGIATFNWDPFLYQACQRNHRMTALPKIFFLHGCSIVGFCAQHKRQGQIGQSCPDCGEQYASTRLLYHVANKDYVSDPYLASQWQSLRTALKRAFILTIFGYGAPVTDAAAIDLMSDAWGNKHERVYEQVEIIDTKREEELVQTWNRFINKDHYDVRSSYFKSLLSDHPRRTCEALWQSNIEARFREENPVPTTDSIYELWDWFAPLREAEESAA